MSRAFTKKQFELASQIIFNIFPEINYVSLNNSSCGKKVNYYLRFHSKIDEQKISEDKDNMLFEFYSKDCRSELFLKDVDFFPQTNGIHLIERKVQTPYYDLNEDMISLKLIPLMEMFKFQCFEIIYRANVLKFYRTNPNCFTNLIIECDGLKFCFSDRNKYFIELRELYPLAKLMYNAEKR